MTIGDRIKLVRETVGKNQRDFASSIKISQPALAMFENGQREVKEIHIEQISMKYNISKDWLRTGKGEMKIENSQEERFAMNIGKLQRTDDETIMRWVNMIAETNPKMLAEIEKFMKKILGIEDEPE